MSDKMYRYYMALAENVERAGDSVGPNDYELSNRLWADAARLREFAAKITRRDGRSHDCLREARAGQRL